jgi:ubiquinone/menaquinone biosynthesis C-methylase UbiE
MVSVDVRFSGAIPENYERYMVPMLFRPYAEELARGAADLKPKRILETAAGTGVVTGALAAAVPGAEIVSTDLNQAMLDVAATRVSSSRVSFRQADALELPFDDASFDLVVCQFGAMFFPDKVKGNSEARRVLRDAGHYLIAIWDAIEHNPMSDLVQQTMVERFPDNPPMFMRRGPFSYHNPEWIERDLKAAGFHKMDIETMKLTSRAASAEEAAHGLCYGSPMRLELEEYGAGALDDLFATLLKSAQKFDGPNGFEAPMSAHIVTAAR